MHSFLMDKKKRRSSIKQTFGIKDDNTTVEAEVRLKRRISFSGKKLVREFLGEEETKTWKDSYEVSDHADGSLGIGSSNNASNKSTENIRSASAVGEQKHTARPIPSDDKENINYHTYPQARSIKLQPSTAVQATSSLLCNTTEFIDQAQPQQSSTLQLDYSVDISLLEQEGRVKKTESRASTLSEMYEPRSFSLDDNEVIKAPTQFERTIDFVQELRKSKQVDKSLSLNMAPAADRNMLQRTILFNGGLDKCMENEMEITTARTLYTEDMDETNCNDLGQKDKASDMEVSSTLWKRTEDNSSSIAITNATNFFCNKLNEMSLHAESERSANIEQEMCEFYKKIIMPVEHHEVPMDITMQCGDIATTAPLETGNIENQQRTLLLNEDMLSDATGIYNKSTQLRAINFGNQRMTMHLYEDMQNDAVGTQNRTPQQRMTMHLYEDMQSGAVDTQNETSQQQMTMLLNEDVTTDTADTHSTLIVSKCEKLNQAQKRQTVVFDDNDVYGDMDICATARLSKQLDTPVQLTQKLPAENISGKATSAGSKVVVVRKICTPNAHKNDAVVGGLDQNRLKRYKQKQEEQRDAPRAASNINKNGNEQNSIVTEAKQKNITFNFSLTNSHFTLLSPELSSPLFSPQYLAVVGKRDLNLQQLCDAIDQGKIQIYPDMPKTPLSARKGKGGVFSTFPCTKAMEAIESEERVTAMRLFNEELEVSAKDEGKENEKSRTTSNSNNLDSAVTASTSCKRVLEFFEEDEMILDSTSFLTKAKLGDETSSRNSSKCSTLNRRETIHFHSEIDSDAVEDDMHATEQVNNTDLKQKDKTSDFLETTKQSLPDGEMMLSRDEHLLSKRTENEDTVKTCKSSKTTAFLESDKQMLASCDTALSKSLYTGENTHLGTNCFPTRDEQKNNDTSQQYTARRQTLHLCEDIPLDMDTSQATDSQLHHCEMADGSNICNANLANTLTVSLKSKSQKHRQTLHFTEGNSIMADETCPVDITTNRDNFLNAMPNAKSHKQRQTLHFTSDNNILAEESSNVQNLLNPDGCKNNVITISDVALGDMEPEQDPKLHDSLEIKLKEMRLRSIGKLRSSSIDIDPLASPMASSNTEVRERARKLFEGTPHRSFIEFELLEREANLEQQQFEENTTIKSKVAAAAQNRLSRKSNYECSDIVLDVSGLKPLIDDNDSQMHMSPVISALTKKRLTVNLTPNLPFPKKRQTSVFQNCNMDESSLYKSATRSLNTRLFKRRTAYGGTMALDEHAVACERAVSDPESSAKAKTKMDTTGTLEEFMECGSNRENAETELSNRHIQDHEKQSNKKTQIVDTKVSPGRSRIPVLKKNGLIVGTLQSPKPLDESALNHSLETIQVPRRATTFVHECKENTLLLPPSNAANQSVEDQKQQQQSISMVYEENPITISDVSVYYLAQRQSVKSNSAIQKLAAVEQTLNTTESIRILSDADEEPELQQPHVVPEPRVSDDCYNKVDKFKKCFINLTCNSDSEIDQTRLSLVETLLDDNDDELSVEAGSGDDDVDENNQQQHAVQEHSVNNIDKTIDNDAIVSKGVDISGAGTSLRNATMCRRCKCRQKMNDTTFSTTGDSFMLPPVPAIPSVNMERLRQLRKRPTLKDVHEYYRRLSLERSFDLENPLSDDDENLETEAEEEDEIDVLGKKLEDNLERLEKQLISDVLRTPVIVRKSFVQRLEALLDAQTQSWIFNYQKQISHCLIFDHKKIITFCLVVQYKELTDMGEVIEVQNIQIRNSRVPQSMR